MREFHAPLLRALIAESRLQILACLDTDTTAARQLAARLAAPTAGRPREVEIDESIDGALIATPPEAHVDSSEPYLSAGKRVLLEKPMTSRFSEAQHLLERARTGGSFLTIDHYWRFFPSVLEAKNLVGNQVFGPVRSVFASLGFRWEWEARSDYVVTSPHGGVILDSGAHVLDAVLFILGMDEPDRPLTMSVRRIEKQPAREPSHEVRADVVVSKESAGDIPITLALSRLQPLPNVISFVMDKGVLLIPSRYAQGCTVWTRDRRFSIQTHQVERPALAATTLWDCYRRAHAEWMAGSTGASILDGSRFLGLSRLMELMWDQDGQ